MATDPKSTASFSPWRRGRIALNVCLIILAVLAILVTINYFSRDYFMRFQWSTRTQIHLAPRTLNLLHSITNPVKVILYYDKNEPLYSTVLQLLNQYALVNQKISLQTVDYLRDPIGARKVKGDYNLTSAEKNAVIFEYEGRSKAIDGNALTHYIWEQVPGRRPRKKPTEFEGETRFSAALLAVASSNLLNAYFLEGHREHNPEDSGNFGYQKFASVLQQNYLRVARLSLLGTNTVPADCNLLVVAGPAGAIEDPQLEKIDRYLSRGGRVLMLFNAVSISKETGLEQSGLEKVLANWGVQVGTQVIKDRDNSVTTLDDMVVKNFSQRHPLVNPLLGSGLYVTKPRAIAKLKTGTHVADAPRVEELAFTGAHSVADNQARPQVFPVMVAVEKGAVQGVITERGATRLVVVGDSFFLANAWIDATLGNREFAHHAINWLVNRPELLEGIGRRPVNEYKLIMSNSQFRSAQWTLLAGLPGSVLILGVVVWLRRRK